jgi:hypothetical protein
MQESSRWAAGRTAKKRVEGDLFLTPIGSERIQPAGGGLW